MLNTKGEQFHSIQSTQFIFCNFCNCIERIPSSRRRRAAHCRFQRRGAVVRRAPAAACSFGSSVSRHSFLWQCAFPSWVVMRSCCGVMSSSDTAAGGRVDSRGEALPTWTLPWSIWPVVCGTWDPDCLSAASLLERTRLLPPSSLSLFSGRCFALPLTC